MIQLVFTATGNVPKLADTINGLTSYGLCDAFHIATEISRGIKRKFPISSIEKTTDIINKTMPAGTLAWHFLNDTTGEIFGGTSGKTKKSKEARTEETKKSSKSEKINEIINSNLQELNKYSCGLEKENLELSIRVNQLLKEREGLLKERDGLSAKLDILSDKFIKLKSIID